MELEDQGSGARARSAAARSGDQPQEDEREDADARKGDAVSLLVSEYEFVENLIPLYRHYELSVLAGLGLVISALVAAVAAIEAGEDPNRSAEAILLAAGAWAPVFLMLVEIVALTRIRRASLYITKCLRPLAQELTGEEKVLRWECAPTEELFKETLQEARSMGPDQVKPLQRLLLSQGLVTFFVSSSPLVLVMFALSVLLAGSGAALLPWTAAIGVPAVAVGAMLAVYGIGTTGGHERRRGEHDQREPPEGPLWGPERPTR
jgi:hypothetical protein